MCTGNGPEFVAFDLSNRMNMVCTVSCNYTSFNLLSLYYLEFWYFGRHIHFADEETMHFCDLILLIQWLNSLDPFLCDFLKLQMEFSINENRSVLKGAKPLGIKLFNK